MRATFAVSLNLFAYMSAKQVLSDRNSNRGDLVRIIKIRYTYCARCRAGSHSDAKGLTLLKESNPGLILELTPDLTKLIEYRKLTKKK